MPRISATNDSSLTQDDYAMSNLGTVDLGESASANENQLAKGNGILAESEEIPLPSITWKGLSQGFSTYCSNRARFGTLSIFVLFKVVLVTLDIGSDLATGMDLWHRGHFWWGFVTVLIMFLPSAANFMEQVYFTCCSQGRETHFKTSLKLLPFIQPLV